MFLVSSIVLFALVLFFVFWVRPADVPVPPPANPAAHLEERKAAIYENLRDLTFEFRLGKLSDADYQKSKLGLQEELARVLAGIDELTASKPAPAEALAAAKPAAAESKAAPPKPAKAPAKSSAAVAKPAPAPAAALVCPHCQACFDKPMKFCGECGKPMETVAAPEANA